MFLIIGADLYYNSAIVIPSRFVLQFSVGYVVRRCYPSKFYSATAVWFIHAHLLLSLDTVIALSSIDKIFESICESVAE